MHLYGPIAPMVEQHPVKMRRPGSSPGGPSNVSLAEWFKAADC